MPASPRARERRRAAPSLLAASLRRAGARGRDARGALGAVVFAGALVAAVGLLAFAWLAAFVRGGRTQAVDDAVLRWLGAHRVPWLERAALEVTFLGAGTVLVVMVGVAALFLALLRQRTAAWLLVWSTVGGIVLNNVLKTAFHRPRPQLFAWGTQVATTSFPSGHAMSAAVVYGTVALLAARLTRHRGVRAAVYAACAVLILGVAFSRLYLGVHYPSDVAAGVAVGGAWAAFCAAALEASVQGRRRRRRGDPSDGDPSDGDRSDDGADGDGAGDTPSGPPREPPGGQPASIVASTRS